MEHKLPSGATVDVRPIQSLKGKDKDVVDASVRLTLGFDSEGNLNTDNLPISMGIAAIKRNALIARLLKGWTCTDGESADILPLPRWDEDHVDNEESIGELPIDDFNALLDLVAPYEKKLDRRPDPKGTTTANSSSTSKARSTGPQRVSARRH